MTAIGGRTCGWCLGPIPAGRRSDAVYCRTLCRQAAHRFQSERAHREAQGAPMRFGYADPPYPGLAEEYYRDHADFAGEVDHHELVGHLVTEFPDGWALSTSAAALPDVLRLCPPGTRVAAWVRGERPTAHLRPLNAWEPVVYHGGRELLTPPEARRTDVLMKHARPRLADPLRVVGAKPAAFVWWMFDLLGALPHDDLVDLYPGSGGVARAWAIYTGRDPVAAVLR